MKLPVLLAQFAVSLSISSNLKHISGLLAQAEPGDLVLFPEGALSGYDPNLSFLLMLDIEELVDALEQLRNQAIQRGIHLWVGSYYREQGLWFNAAFGFTPNGGAHQYRKVNLATTERGVITPGSGLPVFELETVAGVVKVGVQICREIRYPEQWGWLARQGAEVFLHLNNATDNEHQLPIWRSHLVSHAACNQRYLLSSNKAAAQQNCPTMAVSPEGRILAEIISDQSAARRLELDLSEVSNWYLDGARPDVVSIEEPTHKERRKILRSMKMEKLIKDLEDLRANPDLYEESNLNARTEALEFIRMIEEMYLLRPRDQDLQELYHQAQIFRRRLEGINTRLFAQLRGKLEMGQYTPALLRTHFDAYTDYRPENAGSPHYGYDDLDGLVSGVFFSRPTPDETLERQPGMIRYQPTPASVILELIDQVGFKPQDVFFDLGSGLGHVLALVRLLAGVRCVGIEYQPSYAAYAQEMVSELGLIGITILNGDARDADYSQGTVFFMFNPFGGRIFDTIMDKLQAQADTRQITIGSYGSCTAQIAALPWLSIQDTQTIDDFKLAIFRSTVHPGAQS
jgi:predicted amidohydrolase/precorrin-6B methylase 2